MSIQLQKKIDITLFEKISLFTLKNERYLYLKLNKDTSFFILLPAFITLRKEKNFIIFFSTRKLTAFLSKKFENFNSLIEDFVNNKNKFFRKTVILKGAGYTVNLSPCENFLSLNLGSSHIHTLEIPKKKLKVTIVKNSITLEGLDKVLLGDFLTKIRSLKKPDAYKGKGFWLKNEVRVLKEIKKS